jgi:hypothetical protein
LTGACTGRLAAFSTFKNAIDVGRCPTHQIDVVHAVGHQAAFDGLITIRVDSWQPVASREENDQLTMHRVEGIRHYDQATSWLARDRGNCARNLVCIADAGCDWLDGERAG